MAEPVDQIGVGRESRSGPNKLSLIVLLATLPRAISTLSTFSSSESLTKLSSKIETGRPIAACKIAKLQKTKMRFIVDQNIDKSTNGRKWLQAIRKNLVPAPTMSTSPPGPKVAQYPVPLHQRRPVPAYALAWGTKVDYPAPGLVTPELAQNIAVDSIFINFTPSPTPTSTTYIRELIIPDKCEECRLRAKGCDRARPLCGRCRKIGKACIPVSSGFARLRKGRGGKATAAGYGQIWGQGEDPEEVEREEREREKKEKEAKYKEVMTRDAPPALASAVTTAGPSSMPMLPGPMSPIAPMGMSIPKKRKRTVSTALSTQASGESLNYHRHLSFLYWYSVIIATIKRTLCRLCFFQSCICKSSIHERTICHIYCNPYQARPK